MITLIGGTRHGQKHEVAPGVTSLEFPLGTSTLENPPRVERYEQRDWIDIGPGPRQINAKLYFILLGLSQAEAARKVLDVVTGRA